MMYYRISKNENTLFLEKNRPGVGSDLKYKIHHLIFFEQLIVITFATLPTCLS